MDREQAYETSVKLYQDASPGDIGVPLKLFPQEPGALQGSYPYESAVQELKLLTADSCPQRKLECIGESHVCFILAWIPITWFLTLNLNTSKSLSLFFKTAKMLIVTLWTGRKAAKIERMLFC